MNTTKELNLVQFSDLPDESSEDINWKNTHRIGVAEFFPATSEIKLYVYNNGLSYNIDMKRDESLMSWLEHLNDKTWGTSQVLGDLVKCWFRADYEMAIKS